MPLLAALLALLSHGRLWGRFALTTSVSGCKLHYIACAQRACTDFDEDPYFHPVVASWISENSFDVEKRTVTEATANVIVQIGAVVASPTSLSTIPSSSLLPHTDATINAEIYSARDTPYYYHGNAVLIAICIVSIAIIVAQKYYLLQLNRQKLQVWNAMSSDEQSEYQSHQTTCEKDGNKKLDLLFKT